MKSTFDLAILGAGPAGAAAAIVAAAAGLRVLVLERRETRTERPGETLHPGIDAYFRELRILDEVQSAEFLRPDGIEQVGLDGELTYSAYGADEKGRWLGYHARRSTLEQILHDRARNAGATLVLGLAARRLRAEPRGFVLETPAKSWRSRWVMDASGGASIGIDWGGYERLSPPLVAWFRYMSCSETESVRPKLTLLPGGWHWAARVQTSVRAECTLSTQATGKAPGDGWKAADVTWRVAKKIAGANYFRIGDAAARLDPSSGKGVLRAFASASYAVRSLLAVEQGAPRALVSTNYENWLRAWLQADAAVLQSVSATAWR